MIGLEYLCKINGKQYNKLADELGVSKQTITNWIKCRRNIPEKYIHKLKIIFNITDQELILKHLSDEEKLLIDKIRYLDKYNDNIKENEKINLEKEEKILKEFSEVQKIIKNIDFNNLPIERQIFEERFKKILYNKEIEDQAISNKLKEIENYKYQDISLENFDFYTYKNQLPLNFKEIYVYNTINKDLEVNEEKIIDLYLLFSKVIQGDIISDTTLKMILEVLININTNFYMNNKCIYSKNDRENFMNRLARIIMKRENIAF